MSCASVLKIREAGMACTSSSYRRPRTSRSRAGDCSLTIMSAVRSQYTCQSGCAMATGPDKSGDCTRNVSKTRMALRTLPSAFRAMSLDMLSGRWNFSRLATCRRTRITSSSFGAPTRSKRHRERIGAMMRDVLFAHRMRRILRIYFSIVRRSAA